MLWLCSPLIVLAIKNIVFADQIRFFDINRCFRNRHLPCVSMHCLLKVFFSFDLGNLWPNCQHITQYQNTLTSGVFSNKGMSYIYLFRYQVAGILFTLVNLTLCKLMDSSYFVFCLFDLILYVQSTIYQLIRDGSSWVEPVLSKDKCVLLKGFFL